MNLWTRLDSRRPVVGPRAHSDLGRWRLLGVSIVFLWFLIGGSAHFFATNLEMRVVPPYIPWPRAAVWVSGGFELLGAAGLLYRPARRAAGVGLLVLTVAVTPVHFYMLQHAELFAIPYWILVLRLPLQVGLLALIGWSAVRPVPVEHQSYSPRSRAIAPRSPE